MSINESTFMAKTSTFLVILSILLHKDHNPSTRTALQIKTGNYLHFKLNIWFKISFVRNVVFALTRIEYNLRIFLGPNKAAPNIAS